MCCTSSRVNALGQSLKSVISVVKSTQPRNDWLEDHSDLGGLHFSSIGGDAFIVGMNPDYLRWQQVFTALRLAQESVDNFVRASLRAVWNLEPSCSVGGVHRFLCACSSHDFEIDGSCKGSQCPIHGPTLSKHRVCKVQICQVSKTNKQNKTQKTVALLFNFFEHKTTMPKLWWQDSALLRCPWQLHFQRLPKLWEALVPVTNAALGRTQPTQRVGSER